MNALVFAAGLGTRLRPWTLSRPKALVPVGGEPMLGRVLAKLASTAGIGRVAVNVHHFAPQVIDYLRSRDFGLDIVVSDESELLLDTGGGMARALEVLGDGSGPLLVHNADILTDFDLGEMIAAHAASGADATLLVARRESSRQLLFDASGRMRGWENRSSGEVRPAGLDAGGLDRKAFGGVHILGERACRALAARSRALGGAPFGVMPFYIDSCAELDIRGFEPAEAYRWFDIGTPEKLAAAEKSYMA